MRCLKTLQGATWVRLGQGELEPAACVLNIGVLADNARPMVSLDVITR